MAKRRRTQPLAVALSALLSSSACAPRPARFIDRRPVVEVRDDEPINIPRKRTFIEELYQADVYVRRELVNGLDPVRAPPAVDVNALDDVPRSSWFAPGRDPERPLSGYRRDGPPQAPFHVLNAAAPSGTPGAMVIRDARGLPYELLHDIRGRVGMRTGAAAVTSRLLYALGYHTPEVHIIRSHQGKRAAATRWPAGIDLGPTPIASLREDDPNDQLSHRDRRTLRALYLVGAWLDLKRMPARLFRDVYVGSPGKGHVQHFIVGLDGALGVDRYLDERRFVNDPDRQDSNFFLRMFSMGLSPKAPPIQPRTPWPSVGLFSQHVLMDRFSPSPPFEPLDRLRAADLYWMAKRLSALPMATIAEAILDAKLEPLVGNWLFQILHVRRAKAIAYGYDQTTPVEVLALDPATATRPASMRLADLAIDRAFMRASNSYYEVRYLDAEGRQVAAPIQVAARGPRSVVPLPRELAEQGYVVVSILGFRGGHSLPRPAQIHLIPEPEGERFRLIALQH